MVKQQFTVLLNSEEAQLVVELARASDRSTSSIIREAVKLYFMKKESSQT